MADHIEKMWLEYERLVLMSYCDEQDRTEFKEVFFTGAAAVFAVLLGDGTMDDHKKAEMAQAMHEELKEWAHRTVLERMTPTTRSQ